MSVAAPLKGYRLVKRKFADMAFSGYGSSKFGGRWNSPGNSCVYLAECESLAMLEVLVHVNKTELLDEFVLFEIELEAKDVMLATTLPSDWQADPAPRSAALYGDQWLLSKQSLALKVPSTIVPRQWNYLLNIDHLEFKRCLQTSKILEFSFDHRLF
jgi:RES domain-containing protein